MLIERVSRKCISEYTNYVSSNRVLNGLDLKPVHRKILWSMIKSGARHGQGHFRKCSSITGMAMLYHPHSGGYKSLVTMVNQPNAMVQGRGNFGNMYGMPAAAERYTEAKTSAIFEHLLDPAFMEVGEFIPNYDETETEPLVFQTKLPLICLTGVSGIGVGFATSYPALHVSVVQDMVRRGIDDFSDYKNELEYAYGAGVIEKTLHPITSISKEKGKEYLHITEIPRGASLTILSSELISNLVSSGNIEIIDNCDFTKIDIKISAPEDIQKLIVRSLSRSLNEAMGYYYGRYRTTDFLKSWTGSKIDFIQKREYYAAAKEWNRVAKIQIVNYLVKAVKQNPEGILNDFNGVIESLVTLYLNKTVNQLPEGALPYVETAESLTAKVRAMPFSSLKEKESSELPVISEVTVDVARQLLYAEAEAIDESLFSKKSMGTTVQVAKFEGDISRFVAMKGGEVFVSYSQIPRTINHTISLAEVVSIVYSDGSTVEVPKYKHSTYTSDKKKIVGYSIYGRPTVFLTESNTVTCLLRHGYLKEPLISAFPAIEIEIDGKPFKVTNGLKKLDVKSFKVIR